MFFLISWHCLAFTHTALVRATQYHLVHAFFLPGLRNILVCFSTIVHFVNVHSVILSKIFWTQSWHAYARVHSAHDLLASPRGSLLLIRRIQKGSHLSLGCRAAPLGTPTANTLSLHHAQRVACMCIALPSPQRQAKTKRTRSTCLTLQT